MMRFRPCCVLLILFQFILPQSVAQAETDDPLKNSTWIIERETDPILDTTNIVAMLKETGVKKSLFGDEKRLIVRCREQNLDAIVVWGSYGTLGISLSGRSSSEVIVRFSSEVPKTERWMISTDSNATFAPQPDKFVKLLAQHQKFAVRTHPKNGGSLTAVFDLSEATPVVHEVIAACGP